MPFADVNCLKLLGTEGDEFERDFLILADVLPTGYHAAKLANVQPGGTVAIWGAGPVGLMAAISAQVLGAAEVYVVTAGNSDTSSPSSATAEWSATGNSSVSSMDGRRNRR